VNRGERAERAALVIAQQLRAAGLVVQLDGSGAAFAKQFKRADRYRATWALVIGDDEIEQGKGRLKRLQGVTKEVDQTSIDQLQPLDDVAALVHLLRA
jgi:histidyl-tRNA synthetase